VKIYIFLNFWIVKSYSLEDGDNNSHSQNLNLLEWVPGLHSAAFSFDCLQIWWLAVHTTLQVVRRTV